MKKFLDRICPNLGRYYFTLMSVVLLCCFCSVTALAVEDMWAVANRIIEITPNGMIDKYMEYDDYLFDERVQENLSKLYSK